MQRVARLASSDPSALVKESSLTAARVSVRSRSMCALVAALVLSVGVGTASAEPTDDMPYYSQFEPEWANILIGAHRDVRMRNMGSLLTCVAMVASAHGLTRKDASELLATPDYIHGYLAQHNGYRASPPKTVVIDYHSLKRAFFAPPNVPAGLDFRPVAWPAARGEVDAQLNARFPSILYMQTGEDSFHPVVVVTWDARTLSYLVFDPAAVRSDLALVIARPLRELYGTDWEAQIAGALIPTVFINGKAVPLPEIPPLPYLDISAKCPVETIAVDPEGRRVGFDVDTGTTVIDVAGASYLPQPVWADPTGELAPRDSGRLLTIPLATEGRYRFQMIGTGDGPFTLSVRARNAGDDLVVDEAVEGTITAGQVVKFQVEYSSSGPSGFTLGDNFRPEARAGADPRTLVDSPVELDGSTSFDIDGTITSYEWDFGDGATAAGQTVSHAYAAPGTYTATLTVTDDHGETGSDTVEVAVFNDQPTGGTTERASLTAGGEETTGYSLNPALSADGRLVAYESEPGNGGAGWQGIVVRDRQTSAIEQVSPPACLDSRFPELTPDGRFVAFECHTTNGIPSTIVVADRLTGSVDRVDVPDGDDEPCDNPIAECGSIRPAMSDDGRFVAFYSDAPNLVPGDTNGRMDVFVRDRLTGTTERVNVTPAGTEAALGAGAGNPNRTRLGISADGRFVAFASESTDLVPGPAFVAANVFVRDRVLQVTERVSVPSAGNANINTRGANPSISADGRVVAFSSGSTDLVLGDTNEAEDVFVRDRVAGTTERVSISGAGGQSACPPFRCDNRDPVVSRDGRFVVFRSQAVNLVLNHSTVPPMYMDVFIRDRVAGTTEIVSTSTDGEAGNGSSGEARIFEDPTRMAVTPDGRFVAFSSDATNLVPSDWNGFEDIFVRDRKATGLVADPSGPYLGWATAVDRPAFVTFDASWSFDPAGRPLMARWDFGDDSPVTEAEAGTPVSHAYAAAGTYEVTLVVSTGEEESTAVTTVAQVLPPLEGPAMTLAPACARPGDRITAGVAGHPLVSPAGGWDLGRSPLPTVRSVYPDEEVRVRLAGPAGSNPADQVVPIEAFSAESALEFATRFSFTVGAGWASGTYTVTAPDDAGVASTFTVPCPALANEPPRADVGGPYEGTVGTPVLFDGRSSADPEGMPLEFTWVFEDGGTASGPRPSYTFLAPGTYWVVLVVNDGQLESPTSVGTHSYTTVTITEAPPTTTTSMIPTTSTTSTTSPSTSTTSTTSTTTTTMLPTTTTTTMPPESDPCASEPARPAFRSLTCRLAALMTRTQAESTLGSLRERLLARLAKAKERTESADTLCADGQKRRPAVRLRQVGRQLIQYVRRLRAVPEDIRAPLAQTAEAIHADAETLRSALRCPDAASRR